MNKILFFFRRNKSILLSLLVIWIVFIMCLLFYKGDTIKTFSFYNEVSEEYYTEWDKYYGINNDYVCHIVFDTGIINLPVLKSTDNNYYLRRNFYRNSDINGNPFMDYRCSFDDQNIIIYGHYTGDDSNPMFTPLESLFVTRDNDYVNLNLRTTIRRYKLAAVILIDGENGINYPFINRNFSKEGINELNDYITLYSAYHTKDLISKNDNLLTLITCTYFLDEYREIAIFKEC